MYTQNDTHIKQKKKHIQQMVSHVMGILSFFANTRIQNDLMARQVKCRKCLFVFFILNENRHNFSFRESKRIMC